MLTGIYFKSYSGKLLLSKATITRPFFDSLNFYFIWHSHLCEIVRGCVTRRTYTYEDRQISKLPAKSNERCSVLKRWFDCSSLSFQIMDSTAVVVPLAKFSRQMVTTWNIVRETAAGIVNRAYRSLILDAIYGDLI